VVLREREVQEMLKEMSKRIRVAERIEGEREGEKKKRIVGEIKITKERRDG